MSKVKRLLIPQLTLSITIVVLKGGLWISLGNNLKDFDFISCFGFWFLPVLFICSLVYMVVSVLLDMDKMVNRLSVSILSLILMAFTIFSHFSSEFMIVDWLIKSSVAVFFYFCGSFLKDKVLIFADCKSGYRGLWLLVSCCVLVILAQLNEPVKMYQNEYGAFPLFLLTSFLGTWVVIEISKRLTNTTFLNEMGRLSIAVYVWNFLIVGINMRVINLFMKKIDFVNDGVLTAATFLISVVVLSVVSKWTYNKLPFLYGKKY